MLLQHNKSFLWVCLGDVNKVSSLLTPSVGFSLTVGRGVLDDMVVLDGSTPHCEY